MSRATINSAIGEGKYNVTVHYDRSHAEAEITRLQDENSTIATRLAELSSEISAAADDVTFITESLHAAIANNAEPAFISDLQDELTKAQSVWQGLIGSREYLRLKATGNDKRIAWLQANMPADESTTAWCADYNTALSGSVGLIDVGRERSTTIIRPAGEAGLLAGYSAASDGEIVPLVSAGAPTAFYNLALLAAADKWKPRYRTGVASAVDTDLDTMTVSLDPVVVSGININQASVLTAVPVVYLGCNASAFTDGDAVVVDFSGDWSTPTVIGFTDNPNPCCPPDTVQLTGPVNAEIGSTYTATGGVEPYVFTIDKGWIDPATGIITALGTGTCTITVRDDDGCRAQLKVMMPAGEWIPSARHAVYSSNIPLVNGGIVYCYHGLELYPYFPRLPFDPTEEEAAYPPLYIGVQKLMHAFFMEYHPERPVYTDFPEVSSFLSTGIYGCAQYPNYRWPADTRSLPFPFPVLTCVDANCDPIDPPIYATPREVVIYDWSDCRA